ncbi:hypothetical protein K2X89_12870, partial [Myxococcota bacterium]|nr:hypothetical protein [Myxococcota bacterium]
DVPTDALAIARDRQRNLEGWVARKEGRAPARESRPDAGGETQEAGDSVGTEHVSATAPNENVVKNDTAIKKSKKKAQKTLSKPMPKGTSKKTAKKNTSKAKALEGKKSPARKKARRR